MDHTPKKPTTQRGVYAEYSISLKGKNAKPGFNRRTFNDTEFQQGEDIILSDEDGVISLQSGLYHIVANSIITDLAGGNHPGYCVLRNHSENHDDKNSDQIKNILATGTMMNAGKGTTSLIDTYINVTDKLDIVLEHQVLMDDGDTDVYLQLADNGSQNHVFSRISIEQV